MAIMKAGSRHDHKGRCRRALGCMLLAYIILIIAVVTLLPFTFAVPKIARFIWHGNLPDVFVNILLFIPLGFFFRLIRDRGGWTPVLLAFGFGLMISTIVEVGQLFLPSRFSSLIDIVTNGMGAGLGAAMAGYHQQMVRRGRIPDLFGFGLPLISSVYLLVPLLWLDSVSMGNEISRLGLMSLLGVYGAGLISSAVVNRAFPLLKPPGLVIFGSVTAWFMIGTAPALVRHPLPVLPLIIIVGASACLSGRIWQRQNPAERRFELPTLKRLLPFYLLYLLLLCGWPTTVPLSQWSLGGNFQKLGQIDRVLFVARFIESIAAFTLLGFLVAEMAGRRDETGLNSFAACALLDPHRCHLHRHDSECSRRPGLSFRGDAPVHSRRYVWRGRVPASAGAG